MGIRCWDEPQKCGERYTQIINNIRGPSGLIKYNIWIGRSQVKYLMLENSSRIVLLFVSVCFRMLLRNGEPKLFREDCPAGGNPHFFA